MKDWEYYAPQKNGLRPQGLWINTLRLVNNGWCSLRFDPSTRRLEIHAFPSLLENGPTPFDEADILQLRKDLDKVLRYLKRYPK